MRHRFINRIDIDIVSKAIIHYFFVFKYVILKLSMRVCFARARDNTTLVLIVKQIKFNEADRARAAA